MKRPPVDGAAGANRDVVEHERFTGMRGDHPLHAPRGIAQEHPLGAGDDEPAVGVDGDGVGRDAGGEPGGGGRVGRVREQVTHGIIDPQQPPAGGVPAGGFPAPIAPVGDERRLIEGIARNEMGMHGVRPDRRRAPGG